MNYYYLDATNTPQGPFSLEQLKALLAQNVITPQTLVAANGAATWTPIIQILASVPASAARFSANGSYCPDCNRPVDFGCSRCAACGRLFLPQKRSPFGYFAQCISLYATFSGRATRAEYWSFYLVSCLISLIGLCLLPVLQGAAIVLFILIGLALVVPSLAVTWRRLHDAGYSGACYFLGCIPFVGGIILLVLLLMDSKSGPNQYGPATKYP